MVRRGFSLLRPQTIVSTDRGCFAVRGVEIDGWRRRTGTAVSEVRRGMAGTRPSAIVGSIE